MSSRYLDSLVPDTSRTIQLYLVNGEPDGLILVEIKVRWTGVAIVFPRNALNDVAKRDEIQRPGVYALVGPENDSLRTQVYIGEGENVLIRLKQHNKDAEKDFWSRTVVFTSNDQNLTKAHIRYLERELVEIIRVANRVEVETDDEISMNANTPPGSKLPEADVSNMHYFLDQILMLLPVLGFNFAKILRNTREADTNRPDNNTNPLDTDFIYTPENGQMILAYLAGEEFVVRKGSYYAVDTVPSLLPSYKSKRQALEDNKYVSRESQKFLQDTPFNSPSMAFAVATGRMTSALDSWKEYKSGRTYRDIVSPPKVNVDSGNIQLSGGVLDDLTN